LLPRVEPDGATPKETWIAEQSGRWAPRIAVIDNCARDLCLALQRPAGRRTARDVREWTDPTLDDARLRQVSDIALLRQALKSVLREPEGHRMRRMAESHPQASALFDVYPQLQSLRSEIERAQKFQAVAGPAWTIISGLSERHRFRLGKKVRHPL
jgi:hypothetical protein